jgi:hypothetical protein
MDEKKHTMQEFVGAMDDVVRAFIRHCLAKGWATEREMTEDEWMREFTEFLKDQPDRLMKG